MPVVSIIVPVYKVEQYLDRCVESLVGQTFGDIEIILVDDGSPDNSGKMCDTWAEKDERIRVIHKENGGLSDARNYGIEAAQGEYVAFIDSDDWIDDDMIEVLYNAVKQYGADIAECSWRCIYSDRVEEETENTGKVITGDNLFALQSELRWECFKPIACNKLYHKRRIFHNVRYPVGKLHEDEFTTHLAFYNAAKLVSIDVSKYNYDRTREESITNTFCENNLDIVDAMRARLEFFYEKGLVELQQDMENMYFWVLLDRLYKCYEAGIYTERVKKLIYDTNQEYYLNMELDINPEHKFELTLLSDSYKLFAKCRKSEKKRRWVKKMKYWYYGDACCK